MAGKAPQHYKLTGKGSVGFSPDKGKGALVTVRNGQTVTAAQYKTLSKRQQGYFEPTTDEVAPAPEGGSDDDTQ